MIRPVKRPVDEIVYKPAHYVQQVVRWRIPTLFEEEFYFDALEKGQVIGFRAGIHDVNLNNTSELIKEFSGRGWLWSLVKAEVVKQP